MIGQGLRLRRVRSPGPTGPDDNRPANIPVRLTVADVGDMLELVGLAQPGPFLERTVELGAYLGIRRQGRLVAMAGERFHPPGYSEISAVATHPDHRRQGLAELLVGAAATAIAERGDTPFLHASAGNTNAIRLYESMGFAVRRTLSFAVVQAPDRS
jgi:predicted GNAT family acetyltransferase